MAEQITCQNCPFRKDGNHWSSDGWDRMVDWLCGNSNDRVIQASVEWHEERKIETPDWCPLEKR